MLSDMTRRSHPGRRALDNGDQRLPLHARLREELTTRIRVAEWTPAAPIPSEAELAAHYGVSVGTVRRVLGELVDQGMLERRQGDGTYVRRATLDRALYRFFRHGDAADTVPESRILRRRRRTAKTAITTALGVAPDAELLHIERLRLRKNEPLLLEEIWLPLPRFEAIAAADLDELGNLLYPAYEKLSRQIVGGASEELTVGRADRTTARHLGCATGEPVIVIERLARAHDGTPLELRVSRGLTSTFRYHIELT